MSQGTIATNVVILRQHEIATVVYLTQQGYYAVLLPPNQHEGFHTPDIEMLGRKWEIKCPVGNSPHTIKRLFRFEGVVRCSVGV